MHLPFPTLRTDRLVMRQMQPDDLPMVFQGLSHPEVIRCYGVSFESEEATREQMEWFASLEREGSGIWWAMTKVDDGEFVGAIGFNNLSRIHRKAELGFWLLPEHWRKGLVSEALPVVLAHGLDALGLHRMEATVETENTASMGVLQKAGFVLEGTLRDCEFKNGRFISLHVLALLRED
jgi:ribosomal-protein-alanine N-acetyltransferase